MDARFLKIMTCPKWGRVLEVDRRHRHYVASIVQLGCDDCVRKLAHSYGLPALSAQSAPTWPTAQ